MATLLVRNLDPEVVEALKQRAEKRGRSVEDEHRRILRRALFPKRSKPTLLDAIKAMPYFEGDEALFDVPRTVAPMRDPFEDDR